MLSRFTTNSKISPEQDQKPKSKSKERKTIEVSSHHVIELFDTFVNKLGDDWERIEGLAFKLKTTLTEEQINQLNSDIKNCLYDSGFRADFMKVGGIGLVCQFSKNFETKIIF